MKITIASGTQWGDEGKGKISYYLAKFNDICLRVSGGSNAESTFEHKGKNWHFQMIPSGILCGKIAILTDGVLINVDQLISEIKQLEGTFKDLDKRLFISENAHVVLPCHQEKDAEMDEKELKIETIRQGIGPAVADRAYRVGVNVKTYIESNGKPLRVSVYWENRQEHIEILKKYSRNINQYLHENSKNKKVLIQGTQGFMLDNIYGTYPFVTSSSISSSGLLHTSGLPMKNVIENIGIAKAYVTRFSIGPLITECSKKEQEYIRKFGNEFAHTSKTPLRIGWLDLVSLKYAHKINQYSSICITKLDVLSNLKEIPICIAYNYQGDKIKTLYEWSNINHHKYKPIYKIFKGWNSSLKNIKSFNSLPLEARVFISFIEHELNIKVSLISIGARNKEIIKL